MILEYTTAVDDIERKAPTNIPSVSLPPHNCNEETAKSTECFLFDESCMNFFFEQLS